MEFEEKVLCLVDQLTRRGYCIADSISEASAVQRRVPFSRAEDRYDGGWDMWISTEGTP